MTTSASIDVGREKMSHIHRLWFGDDENSELEQADANRQTASLAGLVISLFLVVVGLYLIRELHYQAHLEDCLMSGSSTCQVLTLNRV